ncbi:MAG: hypothetical protein U9R56_06340, partial [candidate division Zixibacteria bacterium]|nr:hypothetical protein [candidate division Zixibacteria bacterium]
TLPHAKFASVPNKFETATRAATSPAYSGVCPPESPLPRKLLLRRFTALILSGKIVMIDSV